MFSIEQLPSLNAALNTCSAVLLITGYILIRKRKIQAHKIAMIGALAASTLFLASYLTYHYHIGSRRFLGEGWIRPVYFSILISHTVLAAAIVPLAFLTVRRAWKGTFERHAAIARRTLPLWLYVSVTGVIIYWMLYRM